RCNFSPAIRGQAEDALGVSVGHYTMTWVVHRSEKRVTTRGGFSMLSPVRFAGIIIVICAVCGTAWAQQIAPAGSGVTVDKVVVDDGAPHTVKYFVKSGSPRLQALVRRVEWTENELSVVEQLQLLKLDTVVNERRVAAVRTAQLTNPYFPPDFIPLNNGRG